MFLFIYLLFSSERFTEKAMKEKRVVFFFFYVSYKS